MDIERGDFRCGRKTRRQYEAITLSVKKLIPRKVRAISEVNITLNGTLLERR